MGTRTDHAGLFKPGQSGNPSGRPKGRKHNTTLAIEALLEGEAEGLARKAVEMALQGHTVALRLCLERLCPPRKSRTVSISLPPINTAADVLSAFSDVLKALSVGDITVDEAQTLAGILETKRKAIETAEFERRIEQLENKK